MQKQAIEFKDHLSEAMNLIVNNEFGPIHQAAEMFKTATDSQHKIYFFGTGHSYIIGQEVFARAGGYGQFIPILMNELGMNHAFKSTLIERTADYATVVEGLYDFQKDDVIVITSNSGRNALVVELALRLKEKGLHIIALTSLDASKNTTSRHESGKLLYQIAELVLDNRSVDGDASIDHGHDVHTGPTSTILGSFVIQLVVTEFVSLELAEGKDVPVFISSNVDAGDKKNEVVFDFYK